MTSTHTLRHETKILAVEVPLAGCVTVDVEVPVCATRADIDAAAVHAANELLGDHVFPDWFCGEAVRSLAGPDGRPIAEWMSTKVRRENGVWHP